MIRSLSIMVIVDRLPFFSLTVIEDATFSI